MEDNKDAIKALIERDADKNFRPQMFAANPVGVSSQDLENKKFTIMTRFDTSTIVGPIKAGQSFIIKLDDRLMVKDGTVLPNILDNGQIIATPSYNKNTNSITYTLTKDINKKLQIPLNIDVDYNIAKIKELDKDATKHSIKNSITGIGVNGEVKLPETVVDNNGNVVNQIIEPGSNNVLEIVDQGKDYKVYMEAKGSPIVENGKLVAIDWQVKFSSNVDLKELGLISNATLVKGSGLGQFENILLNDNNVSMNDLSTNDIEGKFGIVASKNHKLSNSMKEAKFNFRTKVTNVQSKYMIDLSDALQDRQKTGAVIKHNYQ